MLRKVRVAIGLFSEALRRFAIPRAQLRHFGMAAFFIFGLELDTPAYAFGPFPTGATVFVDINNATGNEDGSAAHPFNTIQEGINAAGNGGTVGVAPGTYYESITLASDRGVVGTDPKTTIIDAGNDPGDVVRIINLTNVRVSGFTIRGALADGDVPGGAGVFVNFPDKTVQIDHNIITANDHGIAVFNAIQKSGPTIDGNLIVENNWNGIFGAGAGPVTNNVIAKQEKGIVLSASSVPARSPITPL
jgi:hypothetical protein